MFAQYVHPVLNNVSNGKRMGSLYETAGKRKAND